MGKNIHSLVNRGFALLATLSVVTMAFGQQGEWTWMKGSTYNSTNAVYGSLGIPAAANTPPGFYEPCEWRDNQGNFWLYGGDSYFGEYSNMWKYDPTINEWAWMKGPGSLTGENPVFGTQGVASPSSTPGARGFGSATWVDTSGNLWMLGGRDYFGYNYGDLWKYDIGTNEWTWMKGPNFSSPSGVYGTLGVAALANYPGGRSETSASWTDDNNNLWLFGGYGVDYLGTTGLMNDMWRYNISTNEWTWMRGSKFAGNTGSYGTKGIADTSNNPAGRMIFTKWKDPAGNFWIFAGGDWNAGFYYNDVWKYDPSTNLWTWMSGSNLINDNGTAGTQCVSSVNALGPARFENRACWTDACGNFWTFGGSTGGNLDMNYNDLWHFNYQTLEWTFAEGSVVSNQAGTYGTQGVSSATNQPPSRGGSVSWIDNDGNLWLWGGTSDFVNFFNDLWRYVVDPTCPTAQPCSVPFIYASDTAICEKFCISFSDSSTGSTAWLWLFPGGSPSTSTDQNPSTVCYNLPGQYDVTLITTNASGTDTLFLPDFITVYSTPSLPVITQTGYTLTSSSGVSYQWQFNSVDIPGATNQSYDVPHSGYYTVFITDQNGCSASATVYVLISGIENLISDANLLIYPNPSDGNFIVELFNYLIVDPPSIEVYNTLGQIIFSSEESQSIGTTSSWKKTIDLGHAADGVYFIDVKTKDFFVRKKIIISN